MDQVCAVLRRAVCASLDWLPSLVGGVLALLGFCLVWYRLRRLERHYQRLDDDDKREHVDDAQSLMIVAVSLDDPPPKDDDPPLIPVAHSLSLSRHPVEHCDCDVCILDRRIAMDEAQAQTLGLLDDLGSMRQGLKTLRVTVLDEIDRMERRIATHLGKETEATQRGR